MTKKQMFHGVTALECIACENCYPVEIRLIKEPTKDEWVTLRGKLTNRANLCKYCVGSINV